jgi:hypothetical protein
MVLGKAQADQRSFSITLNEFKGSLSSLNEHLALRNFLVGYQMTLADAFLTSTLALSYELVLDKRFRDSTLQNLSRYAFLLLKMAPCSRVFGQVVFCKDVIQPNFNLEKPKEDKKPKKEADGKEAAKGGKGKEAKQGGKK